MTPAYAGDCSDAEALNDRTYDARNKRPLHGFHRCRPPPPLSRATLNRLKRFKGEQSNLMPCRRAGSEAPHVRKKRAANSQPSLAVGQLGVCFRDGGFPALGVAGGGGGEVESLRNSCPLSAVQGRE